MSRNIQETIRGDEIMSESKKMIALIMAMIIYVALLGIEKVFGERHADKIQEDINRILEWIAREEKDNA